MRSWVSFVGWTAWVKSLDEQGFVVGVEQGSGMFYREFSGMLGQAELEREMIGTAGQSGMRVVDAGMVCDPV